ncbi:DUF3017 domain-containing protein [Arachnia propionica]|uniref:DUF3017 domain-containing protein n=1 Tax=Arachnia propionica TaxID=1750 RepID=A0A3P1TB02_9ACTN|nr:DUF3017 domain-containing protein [Arachnia propionica]MDO5082066.1 DUF3017 domain-containing protein [Arachnia propionica]RRD06617.1 DUF3017 domain-containing protein [Arachnia propionica]
MHDKRAELLPNRPGALLVSVAILLVGVVVTAFGHWRRGAVIMAFALFVAAAARAVLPRHVSGLLVVRRRPVDVLLMGGLGLTIALCALVVPPGP